MIFLQDESSQIFEAVGGAANPDSFQTRLGKGLPKEGASQQHGKHSFTPRKSLFC